MIQRVLGVLATLAIVGGATACSSSSTKVTTTTTDAGTDTKADTAPKTDSATDAKGETAPVCGVDIDCTTGKQCASSSDCDVSGNGNAKCTISGLYIVGPLNPTPICVQPSLDGKTDACDPGPLSATGAQTSIMGCDGDTGICQKYTGYPASCEAACEVDDTGAWTTQCAGKNSCGLFTIGTDSTTMKNSAIGTCQGGCSTDADCGTGAACDAIEKICVSMACATDADCASKWKTASGQAAPTTWQCNTTSKYCHNVFAKNPGDICNPSATTQECYCLAYTGQTQGVCAEACKTGATADCPSGFVCDPQVDAVDPSTGTAIFSSTFKWPNGFGGYCVNSCTADTDCKADWACGQSAGITGKTCRPRTPCTTATASTDCQKGQTCVVASGATSGNCH